jgi:hypothetical protein
MERLMLKKKKPFVVVCITFSGRRHYHGPHAYITTENPAAPAVQVDEIEGEKEKKMPR